jgi:hypothetical protein
MLFCAVIQAQDRSAQEGYSEKPLAAGDPLFVPPGLPSRAVAGESPKAVAINAYVLDNAHTAATFNWIKISAVTGVNLQVHYTGLTTTQVRIHFTVIGPQFYETTTGWYAASYGVQGTVWVLVPKAMLNKKGFYKLIAVVEPKAEGSGDGLVASSTFRIY